MKTYKHLYNKIHAWNNLYLAYTRARKGKRSRPPTAIFEYHQEIYLIELQKELQTQTYEPIGTNKCKSNKRVNNSCAYG